MRTKPMEIQQAYRYSSCTYYLLIDDNIYGFYKADEWSAGQYQKVSPKSIEQASPVSVDEALMFIKTNFNLEDIKI